jgi:hypothetical protein
VECKEDVEIGDLHVQDNSTFSSVEPLNKNGEIVSIFVNSEATAPAALALKQISENVEIVEQISET